MRQMMYPDCKTTLKFNFKIGKPVDFLKEVLVSCGWGKIKPCQWVYFANFDPEPGRELDQYVGKITIKYKESFYSYFSTYVRFGSSLRINFSLLFSMQYA